MALNVVLPLTACVAVSASQSFPPSGRVLQLLWAFPKPLAKCRVPVPEMSQAFSSSSGTYGSYFIGTTTF